MYAPCTHSIPSSSNFQYCDWLFSSRGRSTRHGPVHHGWDQHDCLSMAGRGVENRPSPNRGTGDNNLSSVAAVSVNDGWAVGYSSSNAGPYQTLIQHWNGTTWSIVSSPSPGTVYNSLHGVAAISAHTVWAVGYTLKSFVIKTLIEHWNGKAWSIVSSPDVGPSDNLLTGVAAATRTPGP